MKLLADLTDMTILGQKGMSHVAPRLTARAVVVRQDGKIAVMYAEAFGLYSLPGGGVEMGETPEEALVREVAEETGCVCERIGELGLIRENRGQGDYTQHSYYYVVHTEGPTQEIQLTASEAKHGTSLQWHSTREAWRLIASPEHNTYQRKFLQARDMAALREFMKQNG